MGLGEDNLLIKAPDLINPHVNHVYAIKLARITVSKRAPDLKQINHVNREGSRFSPCELAKMW